MIRWYGGVANKIITVLRVATLYKIVDIDKIIGQSNIPFATNIFASLHMTASYILLPPSSCGGRVVKAMDLKSIGVSPHRFESCPQRLSFFFFFLSLAIFPHLS